MYSLFILFPAIHLSFLALTRISDLERDSVSPRHGQCVVPRTYRVCFLRLRWRVHRPRHDFVGRVTGDQGSRTAIVGREVGTPGSLKLYRRVSGGLEHGFYFPNSWDDDPIWRTHIWKEGLKPPTSMSWYVWNRLDESLLSFSATQLIFCYNKEYWYTNQLYTIYVQTVWGKRSNTSELIMTDNILMVYPLYNHYITLYNPYYVLI